MPNRYILEPEPLVNKLNIQLYDDGHIHYVYVFKPLNTDSYSANNLC